MLSQIRVLGCMLAIAALTASFADAGEKKKLLLIGQGPDGHPPTTHEFMAGLRVLEKCLAPVAELDVQVIFDDGSWTEGPETIRKSDGVVLFLCEGAKWLSADPRRHDAMAQVAARGGGLSALHWAMGAKAAEPLPAFIKLFGGCHGGPDRKYQKLTTTLEPADPRHSIASGIRPIETQDEFYYKLKFAQPAPTPVMVAHIDGGKETVAFAWERPGGGRSFGFSGLHYHENWRKAEYRRLAAQGVLWSMNLPIPPDGLPVEVGEEDLELKQTSSRK